MHGHESKACQHKAVTVDSCIEPQACCSWAALMAVNFCCHLCAMTARGLRSSGSPWPGEKQPGQSDGTMPVADQSLWYGGFNSRSMADGGEDNRCRGFRCSTSRSDGSMNPGMLSIRSAHASSEVTCNAQETQKFGTANRAHCSQRNDLSPCGGTTHTPTQNIDGHHAKAQ